MFNRVEAFSGFTLLEAELKTGRTHQIRVHLAHSGFPIAGDEKYGDFALNKALAAGARPGLRRMFLHAHQLTFAHPSTGEAITVRAPLPAECRPSCSNCANRRGGPPEHRLACGRYRKEQNDRRGHPEPCPGNALT